MSALDEKRAFTYSMQATKMYHLILSTSLKTFRRTIASLGDSNRHRP